MAARENQGLQIALILSVILAVVLAVTTYIFYRSSQEKIKEAQAANDAAKTANALAEAHRSATELLKATLGASTKSAPELEALRKGLEANPSQPIKDLAAEIKKIEEKYNADMQSFASDYPGEKNYTTLPDHLFSVINAKSVAVTDGLTREASLRDERDKAVKGEQDKTKTAEKALQDAFVSREDLTKAFEIERNRFISETDKHAKMANERATELKAKTDEFTKDISTLEANAKTVRDKNAVLLEKIREFQEPSYEIPDGKITHVNQRSNVVWVNLGAADGLRRQVTFSVFDKKATNLKTEKAKGSIEVTRIIEDHLSECRIVSSSVADPLMVDDLAFSPVWQPGQTLHFAIAGDIDYNNDGKSDSELVKNVIRMNGGVIDAEVTADGKMSGTMTNDTRYLVVGKPPDEKSTEEGRKGFTDIDRAASHLGVQKLSVASLLDMMGYKGEASTRSMGKGASSDDYKTKAADGVIRKSDAPVSGSFKKRNPN